VVKPSLRYSNLPPVSLAFSLPFSLAAFSLTHRIKLGNHRCISSASSILLVPPTPPLLPSASIRLPLVDPFIGKAVISLGGHSSGLWSILSTLRCVICENQVGSRLTRFFAIENTWHGRKVVDEIRTLGADESTNLEVD
jgi:hypothetical protein